MITASKPPASPVGALTRTTGGLRKPARVSVTAREWDETRIDLADLRAEAVRACDYLEPRLNWMEPVSIELGPTAHQVVVGCLVQVQRLRRRATA